MALTSISILFFLSGFSAALFEVIWQRQLTLLFGTTYLSTSAILCGLMVGISAGTFISSFLNLETKKIYRLLACNEFLITVASFWLLKSGLIRQPFFGGETFVSRFLNTTFCLGIPSFFIGSTFTFIAELSKETKKFNNGYFSSIYSINTLGTAIGLILTAFFFLRYLGMRSTLLISILSNAFAGCIALINSRRETKTTQNIRREKIHWFSLSPIWICALATGFWTGGLEVLWLRVFNLYFTGNIYLFALLVFFILTGIALGAYFFRVSLFEEATPPEDFSRLQTLLALVTVLGVYAFPSLPVWASWSVSAVIHYVPAIISLAFCILLLFFPISKRLKNIGLLIFSLTAFSSLMLPIASKLLIWNPSHLWIVVFHAVLTTVPFSIVMGGSFMALIRWTNERANKNPIPALGTLSALNSLGFALGALVIGIYSIPAVGTGKSFFILVFGISALAVYTSKNRIYVPVFTVLLCTVSWYFWIDIAPLQKMTTIPGILDFVEGLTSTVTVESRDNIKRVWIDSHGVSDTGPGNRLDQKNLAHIPLLLHPNPKRALTVGLGIGGTSRSMLTHGILVDCVEIEKEVSRVPKFISEENQAIFNNPKYRFINDDARHWMQVADSKYDVISSDSTDLNYKTNADLYTSDYYELVKERLNDDGIAATWIPVTGMTIEEFKILLRTFSKAFPTAAAWYLGSENTNFVILTGWKNEVRPKYSTVFKRIQNPAVKKELSEFQLQDPKRLLSMLLVHGDSFRKFAGEGLLNTDDRPVLAYAALNGVKSYYGDFANNIGWFLENRPDPSTFMQ